MIQVDAELHSKSSDVPRMVTVTEVSAALVGVIIVSDPARCIVNVPVVLKLTTQRFPILATDAAGSVNVSPEDVTTYVPEVSSITAFDVTVALVSCRMVSVIRSANPAHSRYIHCPSDGLGGATR
jgi:hypothetical protein